MSMLDNLAEQGENDWLAQKLEDNPEEDRAIKTTARIATAHIWPFLASSISDDDYRARKGVKTDEVTYICSGIAAHTASAQPLVDYVMAGFDRDYTILAEAARHHAVTNEEQPSVFAPFPSFNQNKSEEDEDDDGTPRKKPPTGPGLLENPTPDQALEGGHGYYSWSGAGGMQNQQQWMKPASLHAGGPYSGRRPSSPGPPKFAPQSKMSDQELVEHVKKWHGLPIEGLDRQGLQESHNTDHIEGEASDYSFHHHDKGTRRTSSLHAGSTVGYGDEAVPFELLSPEERTAHIAEGHQMDPSTIKGMSALGSAAMHQVLHDEAGLDVQHYHPRGDFMGSDPGIQIDRYGHISIGAYDRSRDPQLEENDDPDPDRYWADQEAGNPENDVYEHPEHEHVPSRRGRPRERNPRKEIPETWRTDKTSAVREAQLARVPQRPLEGHWRSAVYEGGYDPSEAFPGYYGATERPERPRTAQGPGTSPDTPNVGTPGSASTTPNVGAPPPPTPPSDTGASGSFDPTGGIMAMTPGGPVSGDMSQGNGPQDMQAQLGQLPALSHKVGAKLAEIAAEALHHNADLTAVAAIELALKALRLYPKVAMGGTDYLDEPERLTDCPQCARRAYNPEINRCHNCGFYDAGAEPAIEIT